MSLSRRQFLSTLGAGAAALMLPRHAPGQAPASSSPAPAGKKPNIVLILADDLGNADLGCYGQTMFATPNIDKLAAEGLRFTSAYAGSMVCAPSRCTLMTGKHSGHATIRHNWEHYPEGQEPLKADEVTVAQVLKAAGYATGCCGKWGLGYPDSAATPDKKGFDFFYGYNCQRQAHTFYPDYLWRNTERVTIPQSPEKRTYAQELIANESLKFIRDHKDEPFFLFCAWTVPHGPYGVNNVPSIAKFADKPWTNEQKVYATMVERLDSDVGHVMALLKELKLDDNTLVLFASDNGAVGGGGIAETFKSTGGRRGLKGTLYEGGIQVPMIARWPGRVPAGKTTAFATAFYDFLPTCAALAGAGAPAKTDGLSILPTLLGQEQKPHDALYWEEPFRNAAGVRTAQAVRMGDWKAFRPAMDKPLELYNLKDDPAESKDVAAANPEVVKKIEAVMAAAHVDIEIPKPDPRVWQLYNEQHGTKKGAAGAAGAKKKGKKKSAAKAVPASGQ